MPILVNKIIKKKKKIFKKKIFKTNKTIKHTRVW